MSSMFQEFHITKWKELSADQRFEALQSLEEFYAKQQGRAACKLEMMDKETTLGSFYQNKIYINKTKLLHENACYQAVHTVLHEGRHAFQVHTLRSSPNDSKEELSKWKENLIGGYLRRKPEYWFQSIEKDANDYAFAETDKIYTQLEEELGENIGYNKYKERWSLHFQGQALKLKYNYGENFQQAIDDKVHRKYDLVQNIAKEYTNQKAMLLNDYVEDYIHQAYPRPTSLDNFKLYIEPQIQKKGFHDLTAYIEYLEKDKKNLNQDVENTKVNPPTLPINTVNKMEQVHTYLTQQFKETKASDQHPNLANNIDKFTKAVQNEFQKQYPDLKLKPFYLSSSKAAIEIMKHNSETGQIVSPEEFKELDGLKQGDINKIVDLDRKYDLER